MKMIMTKLVVEVEFVSATHEEAQRVVQRHSSYLGLDKVGQLYAPEMVLSEKGSTVRVMTKEVELGGFDD